MRRLLEGVNAETKTGHPDLNSLWNVMMMMKVAMQITISFLKDSDI
jgi:hypothetical protein